MAVVIVQQHFYYALLRFYIQLGPNVQLPHAKQLTADSIPLAILSFRVLTRIIVFCTVTGSPFSHDERSGVLVHNN